MSRLQTFLVNEGRSKSISIDRAKLMLFSECSDVFKAWRRNKEEYIFRGIRNSNDNYKYIDSKYSEERKSANTTNEYTLLINHVLDSWKKYPKRSVICSTDKFDVDDYGDNYYIFPVNGTKIGVCPDVDIWLSFDSFDQLTDLNDFILDIYGNYNSIKELKKWLKKTTIRNIENMNSVMYRKYEFINTNYDYNMIIYDILNNIMNPDKNGFKLLKAGQPLPKEREVWFHGKALMVRYWPKDIMEELLL